jgi:hypothetical protein
MVRDPRRGTLTSRGNMFLMYKIGSSDPSVHKATLQHRGGAERRPRYKDGGRARPVGRRAGACSSFRARASLSVPLPLHVMPKVSACAIGDYQRDV